MDSKTRWYLTLSLRHLSYALLCVFSQQVYLYLMMWQADCLSGDVDEADEFLKRLADHFTDVVKKVVVIKEKVK